MPLPLSLDGIMLTGSILTAAVLLSEKAKALSGRFYNSVSLPNQPCCRPTSAQKAQKNVRKAMWERKSAQRKQETNVIPVSLCAPSIQRISETKYQTLTICFEPAMFITITAARTEPKPGKCLKCAAIRESPVLRIKQKNSVIQRGMSFSKN